MRSVRRAPISARERRGLLAVLAALALLVQALMPAASLAADARGPDGAAIVLCTHDGPETITVDAQGKAHVAKSRKGFAGLPCHDCLTVASAAVPAPPPLAAPISYRVAPVIHAPERGWAATIARAPPRPPGQGPPTA